MFLPDFLSLPPTLEQSLEDSDYYSIVNLNLAEFIDRIFIEGFVKRGEISTFFS